MSGLSDDDVRAAAKEAGVSPIELRQALAKRDETALATTGRSGAAAIEGGIGLEARAAITAVRERIEASTGLRGHAQGDARYDIVDSTAGLTYRIEAVSEHDGETLVRVGVDTSAGSGVLALAAAGIGGLGLTLFGLGWLFSLTTLWVLGLGAAVLGGATVGRSGLGLASARRRGEAIAAQALADAQSSTPLALGPGDDR
jgi:hypothetical protein